MTINSHKRSHLYELNINATDHGEENHVLLYGEVREEQVVLWTQTQQLSHLALLGGRVVPLHVYLTLSRIHHSYKQPIKHKIQTTLHILCITVS